MPSDAPSLSYFDKLLATSEDLIARISGSPAAPAEKQTYYDRVREIFRLLSKAHAAVADTAQKVHAAGSLEDARRQLELLDQMGIASALRARDLCDQLEAAGHAFRPLLDVRRDLDQKDKDLLSQLTTGLEHREAETAVLYQTALYDLRGLALTNPDLDVIKRKTGETADELVLQKAKFDTFVRKIDRLKAQLN